MIDEPASNNDSPKEKPWAIESWDDFREELRNTTLRAKLWVVIRAEAERRGNWRTARGKHMRKRS